MPSKYIKPSAYRLKYFVKGSAPSVSTIRRWIETSELPGIKIGSNYYVDESQLSATGNPLVDSVLNSSK
jgi:hypothetical protein